MRYEEYKTAEMPWINKIPAHWSQIRNGGLFEYHQDKVGADFGKYQLLSLSVQGIRVKNILDTSGKVPASYEGYQKVSDGDMVFCLFDLDCSAVFSGLSELNGMITSAYDVMTPKCKIVNPKYLDYYFKAVFAGRYYKIFAKSVRYTINYDVFKALKSPVPPREEQDQIVRYLDWKVSCINKLIHGYQRQIKLLEERYTSMVTEAVVHGIDEDVHLVDVNIQGFDRIPDTWKVVQNKRIFRERSDVSKTGNETLLSVSKRFGIKPYNKLEEREKLATIKPADSLVGYKKVAVGNLAMNIMRARNGSYGISDYEGIVSPAYCVYELVMPADSRYIHYLLKTPQVISLFEAYSYGICEHRRRLYAPDFLRLYLPIPPVEEQKEIADYIAVEEKRKHNLIKQLEKKISLLKEYRTRLISDVVTGQMDVRSVVVPDYTPEDDTEENEADDETTDEEVSMDAD